MMHPDVHRGAQRVFVRVAATAMRIYNTFMQQITWRKALPVVQLAAYVLLVWYGCWYRPTWQHWVRNWISPGTQAGGWYPAWVDGAEPFPEQLAAGINFPATWLSGLTIILFSSDCTPVLRANCSCI